MTTIAARSDARGLRQLALHLCALAATGICLNLALGSLWSAPALVLHGVVLVFLFAAEHESIHRTAFRSRWLNDVVASLCGLAILLPAGYFRLFHFAHHRYTQDPARDPELAVAKPRTLAAYAWTVSGLPYAYERISTTLRHARGRVSEPFIPASAAHRVVAEARLVLCCYALVAIAAAAFGSWSPVIYWIAPLLVGQPVLRLYLLAEHTGRPEVRDMLVNTRTTRTNAWLRRFAWNMPYHAEHHAHPGAPFHALPALHAAMRPRIAEVAPGYLAVHRKLLRDLAGEKAST